MRLIQASQLPEDKFKQFVAHNAHIDVQSLRNKGYVVEIKDKLCGCFQLEKVAAEAYWLKQLYIVKKEAKQLPVLLELVLLLVKRKHGKRLYAHSKQPVTDLLLDSFSFSLQGKEGVNFPHSHSEGHWWLYNVS